MLPFVGVPIALDLRSEGAAGRSFMCPGLTVPAYCANVNNAMTKDSLGRENKTPKWSDAALCRLIWDARREHGACTIGTLVKATGQSKQALANRIRTMQKRGLVRWTPGVHGSLRTTDETVYLRKTDER